MDDCCGGGHGRSPACPVDAHLFQLICYLFFPQFYSGFYSIVGFAFPIKRFVISFTTRSECDGFLFGSFLFQTSGFENSFSFKNPFLLLYFIGIFALSFKGLSSRKVVSK